MNTDCAVLQGQIFTSTALTLPAVYDNVSHVRTVAADPSQRLPQRPPNAEDIDPQTSMPVTPQRTRLLHTGPHVLDQHRSGTRRYVAVQG